MIINEPQFTDLPHLRNLWMEAFEDSKEFWFYFIHKAKPLRCCRCVWEGQTLAAALYWFDCTWEGKKLAYLYGVATAAAFRGRGLCRALMENTHAHLKELGYDGCILVPGGPELFEMYRKMGYSTCTCVREFTCTSGEAISVRPLTAEEYTLLRRQFLPAGGVLQEGKTIDLLESQCKFYAGEHFLALCSADKQTLIVSELLGDANAAPGLLGALGYTQGKFRVPGEEKPFAMYHPLTDDTSAPSYFGLAMD